MFIWVDADSIQSRIREHIYKRCEKEKSKNHILALYLIYVANSKIKPKNLPKNARLLCPSLEVKLESADITKSFIFDANTDNTILKYSSSMDLAITRDIALAEKLVNKNLYVINDRGLIFTKDNAAYRRSLRDINLELRQLGILDEIEKKSVWSNKEFTNFANAFDRILQMMLKI